ncbi:MAG: SDR family oxidoreductase [Actinobacteria bacterium]|nr:SDR family oxidoreductase [Actinomycetota bacterium]
MEKITGVLSQFSLKGETALVTGGGRGLGRELAIGLAEAGADVAIADLLIDESRQTADEIIKLGRKAVTFAGDVGKEEDVEKTVKATVKQFGKLDILVCCAGIATWYPAEDMPYEKWQALMDVNLNGVFLYCKWAAKEMKKKKKGSIINIASMSAYIVNVPQKQCHYNASKAAVVHLSKSLAVEWAPYNIRVNALCPGYVMTPLLKIADKKMLKQWSDICPQKRIPDPAELKGITVFLASKASGYFTGSAIIADGGYSLW